MRHIVCGYAPFKAGGILLLGACPESHHCKDDYSGDCKDTDHAEAHNRKGINECFKIDLHNLFTSSQQVQDHAACDNGGNLTGNIDADGMH